MPRMLLGSLAIALVVGTILLLCNQPIKIDARLVGEWEPVVSSPTSDGIIFYGDGGGDFVSWWRGTKSYGPGVHWRIDDDRIRLTLLGEEGETGEVTYHAYSLSQDDSILLLTPPPYPLAGPEYRRLR